MTKTQIPETVPCPTRLGERKHGEMEIGEGEGQPECKDSTERMQDYLQTGMR